nr:MAG TPA: hypothetical protein [Caudoviricetes sp.]
MYLCIVSLIIVHSAAKIKNRKDGRKGILPPVASLRRFWLNSK